MCFFQDGLHDLRFIILLDLLERISTIAQGCQVRYKPSITDQRRTASRGVPRVLYGRIE